ncbi:hypothetical protein E2C01_041997 [Portunus trituberculatus]|uniref:Uncharacterized protein n=1 Tax=Portunus trituberculatus TaxID=210409 RepID=A0A5B7FSH9_PORTR|nr:hypothetical protein [Portunus trituberculatus]
MQPQGDTSHLHPSHSGRAPSSFIVHLCVVVATSPSLMPNVYHGFLLHLQLAVICPREPSQQPTCLTVWTCWHSQ